MSSRVKAITAPKTSKPAKKQRLENALRANLLRRKAATKKPKA